MSRESTLAAAPHAAEPVALYDFLVNATSAAALLTVDQTHNLQACLRKASPLAQWAHDQYHAMRDAATLEHSDLALLVAAVALVASLLLAFFGVLAVRPLNFVVGAYAGAIATAYLIENFLNEPSCELEMVVSFHAALIVGTMCVCIRPLLFAAVGLLIGEVTGGFVYMLLLSTVQNAVVSVAWLEFSMGAGAILGALVAFSIGELSWIVLTALVGSHYAVVILLELFVIPHYPAYLAYSRFAPHPALLVGSPSTELHVSGGLDAHVLLPAAATIALALLGVVIQGGLVATTQSEDLLEATKEERRQIEASQARKLEEAKERAFRRFVEKQPLL